MSKIEYSPMALEDLKEMNDYVIANWGENYIFYYLEADKIRIVRVLNELQDYMQQLFGDSSESD